MLVPQSLVIEQRKWLKILWQRSVLILKVTPYSFIMLTLGKIYMLSALYHIRDSGGERCCVLIKYLLLLYPGEWTLHVELANGGSKRFRATILTNRIEAFHDSVH